MSLAKCLFLRLYSTRKDIIHLSRRVRLIYSRCVKKIVKYLQDVKKAALLIQLLQILRLI